MLFWILEGQHSVFSQNTFFNFNLQNHKFFALQTSKQAPSKGKVLSAKISARVDSGRSGGPGLGGPSLAPPMSSVIVERHQPVTKVLFIIDPIFIVTLPITI